MPQTDTAISKNTIGSPSLSARMAGSHEAPDPRKLARELNAFTVPRLSRSVWEVIVTFVPFVALFAGLLFAVEAGYYWSLILTPLAGLFLLRMFIIQHDCSHGSFLASKAGNVWLGRAIGVLTLTPYDCWARSHALHHANTGNLGARGAGDVDTLTVREFEARSWLGQLGYKLYRHPAVLLGLGPAYLFLLQHRLPIGLMRAGGIYWFSAMATTSAAVGLLTGLSLVFGADTTALVFLPVLLIAASIGVWLFYVQHQFEHAFWEEKRDWSFHEAAMGGSSYLPLPAPLRWFTGNIGVHHVHHLASRIPFYALPTVLKTHPELEHFNRLSLREAIGSLGLALWDTENSRLVSFREAARARA